jgi:uncharacterized membrane protein
MSTKEATMTADAHADRKHLFVLGYPDADGAERAVGSLAELERTGYLAVTDYAVISKGADGKLAVREDKRADHGAGPGAVAGGVAGGLLAVFAWPIGVGAVVVGAGIGAVTSALHDAGFKSDDLQEVGRLMEGGRAILIVAVAPDDTDRMRDAIGDVPELRAADRRWEADLAPDSKNVLGDAIEQWRREERLRAEEGLA